MAHAASSVALPCAATTALASSPGGSDRSGARSKWLRMPSVCITQQVAHREAERLRSRRPVRPAQHAGRNQDMDGRRRGQLAGAS